MAIIDDLSSEQFYHGTKADLNAGDLIEPGYNSNYGSRKKAGYVYLTATLEAATWGAELAQGEGRGRIYIVEPMGALEDDPNVTDKRFPGNPTRSYRTREPVKVVGELRGGGGAVGAPHDRRRLDNLARELLERQLDHVDVV